MIVLWLLVSHLVGDYLLQTRWQAVKKFGWSGLEAFEYRTRHCLSYTACFVPIAAVYANGWWQGADFVVLLYFFHFLTDAQRFVSTPGEWLAWKLDLVPTDARLDDGRILKKLPPNPWPSIGLAIDQTLHLIQIAVLATLFLS